MPTLEQIRDTFAADRFATDAAGCEIRLAESRVMPFAP